jgi:hypothetical protein
LVNRFEQTLTLFRPYFDLYELCLAGEVVGGAAIGIEWIDGNQLGRNGAETIKHYFTD